MNGFASVKIGLDLSRRRGAAFTAVRTVEEFAGTRNVALDTAAGTISFEILFPGNLTGIVKRLESNLIPVAQRADVSFAVGRRFGGGDPVDPAELIHRLEEGNEVWDVQFARGRYVFDARVDAGRVQASIVPSTSSMHEIYDALLSLDVIALDLPPPLPA